MKSYGKLKGRTPELARLLYLQIVRQWPFYGSTFFLSCVNPPPSGKDAGPQQHTCTESAGA